MIIDGKKIAKEMALKLKQDIKGYYDKYKIRPSLHIIIVGADKASKIYARSKLKVAEHVGIETTMHMLEESATQQEVLNMISNLNLDFTVHGILVEMPLPPHIDKWRVLESIAPAKDIDGMTPANFGKLVVGNESYVPNAARAVITLLEKANIQIEGADVCIINRTYVIGKPLTLLFLNRHATVTVCHTHTKDLKAHTLTSDIVVVAVGKPGFLTQDMVNSEAVVIDVGINTVAGKIVGDVDFENVQKKVKTISPVPGGVGPVATILSLKTVFHAYKTLVSKKEGI